MVDKSEKFRWLVRLGFAARGVVYLLLGYIALATAGEAQNGQSAVFDYIQEVPFGTPLLWIMALGLLGYAAFKFLSAFADIQHRGNDTMGGVKRIGDAASGVAHSFLAYACYQFASGAQQSSGGGSSGEEMAGSVLSMELGSVVIGAVGLGFLVAGVMQGKKAWTCEFMHRISGRAPSGVRTIGRIGHAARAIVFAIIGWSMVQGAWFAQESQIKGLGEAILSLRDTGALYTLVAVGLMLFGAFSLVLARYRIIPDLGPRGLRPSFRT
ncbi:DUF1206 domain-containing protein [Pelagerythrobacter rhizovicinus]|uniref:DUF1206 domain-containing protein n=1 Tax=Pelagerythrobacter rhizovicinus TaxID=2268576 RepID=A0A4Q2KS49_9SPHN|nr:DUF1206 domain-containing protein [Pelagerythrobacter rhizovicinus]RXZ66181.1 DUF1206 domain-containing protein [Pelagerythrobacter rhizovicinus]